MNQGTTEVMLALGLEDSMVGTAYLDDYIWPAVEEAYNKIPVIGTSYPNITTLLSVDPDFIYASYSSAFATSHLNYSQFVDANEEGECDLVIERKPGEFRSHCRQELNDKGIQTYLQKPACELTLHRPDEGYSTIDTLYDEIWDIASIFNVYDSARKVVDGIEGKRRYLFKLLCCVNIINLILTRNTPISLLLFSAHFTRASRVAAAGKQAGLPPISVLWLDGWDTETPFVGACCGSIQTIIEKAGKSAL